MATKPPFLMRPIFRQPGIKRRSALDKVAMLIGLGISLLIVFNVVLLTVHLVKLWLS